MKPVALITGAAHGIGRGLAIQLAREGYAIGAIDIDGPALTRLTTEMGALTAVADVTDAAGLQRAMQMLEANLGPASLLVANAGVGMETTAYDFRAADFERVIRINLLGVSNSVAAVLPGMIQRKSGHLVGLSSLASFRGLPRLLAYSTSKAGEQAVRGSTGRAPAARNPRDDDLPRLDPDADDGPGREAVARHPRSRRRPARDRRRDPGEACVRGVSLANGDAAARARDVAALMARSDRRRDVEEASLLKPRDERPPGRDFLGWGTSPIPGNHDPEVVHPWASFAGWCAAVQWIDHRLPAEPMISLHTYIAPPSPCGYLPDRQWSLEYEFFLKLRPADYMERMRSGWRRFGFTVFRPHCSSCDLCRSIRLDPALFRPNRSQRAPGPPTPAMSA